MLWTDHITNTELDGDLPPVNVTRDLVSNDNHSSRNSRIESKTLSAQNVFVRYNTCMANV